MICQACKSYELEKPVDQHPSYLICPSCKAIQLTYQPMPHQAAFHADPAKYRMFAGGYGSAKTRTTVEEVKMLALENPGTQGVMTAQTLPQLRETSMSMFFKEVMPPPLIKQHRIQENKTILINGTEILWRPADEEGKLRSLNLGFFHIEEASEVKYDIFLQLQSRLRDINMKNHRGLLSTNPDLGWVKHNFLLISGKIYNAGVKYHQDPSKIDPNFSTHIAATHLNIHLPPGFIEDLMKNKPSWWVERYLKGSFQHSEGMVYPNFSKTIIEPFEIPKHWEHRIALDHGMRNPTAVLFIAINTFMTPSDFDKPKVVVYDEHYEAGKLVPYHATVIKSKLSRIPYGRLTAMRIDPSTRNKDAITGKSVQAYYQEMGLFFQPANNSLDLGLAKVNTYIETDSLKIFNTCVNTIEEGLNYKYPEQELDEDKNADEKPRKYKDHAMDALRYVIVDLPDDPNQLMNPSYDPSTSGRFIHTVTKEGELIKTPLPHALQTDDEYGGNDWTSYV